MSFLVAVVLFLFFFFIDYLSIHFSFLKYPGNPQRLLIATGFLFFFVYMAEELCQNFFLKILCSIGLTLTILGIFWLTIVNAEDYYFQVSIFLLLSSVLLIGKVNEINDDKKIWLWQNALAKSIIESAACATVFILSIFLMTYLITFLFEIRIPLIFEFLGKFGLTIFPCLIFLFRMPTAKEINPQILKNMLWFVIIPLWLFYIVLLNIYALKILLHWSLPKGMVTVPIAFAFLLYVASWWGGLHLGCPKRNLTHILALAKWMHLPLVLLYSIAIWRRISDYGFTQPRYCLLLVNALFMGILILDLTKKLNGRNFTFSFWATCLLSLIPISG